MQRVNVSTRIFISLLNEGTDCWRPANAKERGEGVFEILGIIPAGEEWQFAHGMRVRCRPKQFADGSTARMNQLSINRRLHCLQQTVTRDRNGSRRDS